MKVLALSEDVDLLLLLKNNDEGAFSEIYNRYWKLMYTTANNILQNEIAAQDIVQNIFINIWERRKEVEIKLLKAYLLQAVRFQVFRAIKAKKTDTHFYRRLADVSASIVYENPMLSQELELWFKNTMEVLPKDCQHIFKVSREEQLTYREIAVQLSISEKTVEKKMTICLKHIRQTMQQNPHILQVY